MGRFVVGLSMKIGMLTMLVAILVQANYIVFQNLPPHFVSPSLYDMKFHFPKLYRYPKYNECIVAVINKCTTVHHEVGKTEVRVSATGLEKEGNKCIDEYLDSMYHCAPGCAKSMTSKSFELRIKF